MTKLKCLILSSLITFSSCLYAQTNPSIVNGRYGIGDVHLGQTPMEIMAALMPGQMLGAKSLLGDWCKEIKNSRLFDCRITPIGTNLWFAYERPSDASYYIYNGRLVQINYRFDRRVESNYNFIPFNEWIDDLIELYEALLEDEEV